MPKISELVSPWFQHDFSPRADKKILKMFSEFRKIAKNLSKSDLEQLVPLAAYGIFWSITEYMHQNQFTKEDIEILADDLRISPKIIEKILTDFDLFHFEEGFYISDRVIRNIEEQEAKQKSKVRAANKRWVVAAFRTYYKEIFGTEAVLKDDEANALADYACEIKDLKELLPDIIYTLKELKFANNPNFNPSVNWLLKENHLGQLVNGEFGYLKHYKTKEEIAAEIAAKEEEKRLSQERQNKLDAIGSKEAALELISQHKISALPGGKIFIEPALRQLMARFDITVDEVKKVCPH